MYIYTRKDGRKYKLIHNKVIVRGGKESDVYYFVGLEATNLSKGAKVMDNLPKGYKITEIGRAGNHPVLSKIRTKEDLC